MRRASGAGSGLDDDMTAKETTFLADIFSHSYYLKGNPAS